MFSNRCGGLPQNANAGIVKRLADILLIRDDELGRVAYFLALFIVIGTGMAIGRSTADALFFKRYGIEFLPLMFAILSVVLAMVSIVYAAYVDRLSSERFFKILFAILAIVVLASWAVMAFAEYSLIYPIYFLIYETASELLLVHSAFYVSQNLDTLQAKRLSPLIFSGTQIGMILGGLLLTASARSLGVNNILLLWVVLLLAGGTMISWWHTRHGASTFFRAPRKTANSMQASVRQVTQGIKLTRDLDLLRYISMAMFFMVIAFYILCYSVNRVYTNTFETEESLTAFFGVLVAANSTLSLILQLFVTGRVIERLGVRPINLLFPVTTVASYTGLMFHYSLSTAIAGSVNKDALMPAFRNPVTTMFFNALPQHVQGRARAMSVALVMPLALLVCAAALWFAQRLDNPIYVLIPGLVAAAAFFHYSRRMNGAYVKTLIGNLKERLYLPQDQMSSGMRGGGDELLKALIEGIQHDDEQVSLAFARTLSASHPEKVAEAILSRKETASAPHADQLMKLIAGVSPASLYESLSNENNEGDDHLRATLLNSLLGYQNERIKAIIIRELHSANPRLAATAIRGILRHPIREQSDTAINRWRQLLAGNSNEILASFQLIPEIKTLDTERAVELQTIYPKVLKKLMEEGQDEIVRRALDAFSAWPDNGSLPELLGYLTPRLEHPDPHIRASAVSCLHVLPEDMRNQLIAERLDDGHQAVRKMAVKALQMTTEDFPKLVTDWLLHDEQGSPRAQKALLEAALDEGIAQDAMIDIATAKSKKAQHIFHALELLRELPDSADPALSVLQVTLKERMNQLIDLSLLALKPLSDPITIAVVQAGLQSADKRHIANACEALQNLDDHHIAQILSGLLQGKSGKSRRDRSEYFMNLREVLEWCVKHTDAWVQTSARKALETL